MTYNNVAMIRQITAETIDTVVDCAPPEAGSDANPNV